MRRGENSNYSRVNPASVAASRNRRSNVRNTFPDGWPSHHSSAAASCKASAALNDATQAANMLPRQSSRMD